MSWNGTVRCSHCYQTGHNRRKCPELTKQYLSKYKFQIAKIAEYEAMTDAEAQANGTDIEWNVNYHKQAAEKYRSEYMKRTKIDPATGQKITNKAAKAERMKKVKCGYCGERGHTRRSCQNVKNDYAIYAARTRQARKEWHDRLKSMGVSVGAMVIHRNQRGYNREGEWGSQTVTGLITEIDWSMVDAHSDGRPLIVRTNAELRGENGYYVPTLPNMSLDDVERAGKARNLDLTVIPAGPAPEFPEGWESRIPSIKEVFSTSDERPWGYQGYNKDDWQEKARADLGLPTCAYSS